MNLEQTAPAEDLDEQFRERERALLINRALEIENLRLAAERYRAEAELAAAEARLALSLDGRPAGTWEWYLETDEHVWTRRERELLGVGDDPASFERLLQAVHPDDRAAIAERMRAAPRLGGLEDTFRIVRPDGTVRWIEARARVIRDRRGVPARLVGVHEDVTSRREEGQQRDEIISLISHELKTPLTVVQLQIHSLVRMSAGADERIRLRLRRAALELERFGRLIDDLIDGDRVASGRLELMREPVDVADVVRTVTEELLAQPERPDVTLLAPEPVVGTWDRARLRQLARSLLEDAYKLGGSRPLVVRVEVAATEARILTGEVLAEPDAAALMQRIADKPPIGHRRGLSLGVWLARQIAEAHGGAIRVAEQPGAGPAFLVTLPRARP